MPNLFAVELNGEIGKAKRGNQAQIKSTLKPHQKTGFLQLEVRLNDMDLRAASQDAIRQAYAKYIERSKANQSDRPIQVVGSPSGTKKFWVIKLHGPEEEMTAIRNALPKK